MRLGIIGGGRAAWAFGWRWKEAGESLAGIHLRRSSASVIPEQLDVPRLSLQELVNSSDIILVAVHDHDIATIGDSLMPLRRPEQHIGHASGCVSSSVLGASNSFSLHPLRALPPAASHFDSRGTLMVFEGAADSIQVAELLAATWGGRLAAIDSASKTLYHSAAVFAANYSAVLLDVAERLMREAGVDEITRGDLTLLAGSAAENWRGAPQLLRFTGPIIRGDLDCVEAHLAALEQNGPARDLYVRLARELLRIASKEAPERTDLQEIDRRLGEALLP